MEQAAEAGWVENPVAVQSASARAAVRKAAKIRVCISLQLEMIHKLHFIALHFTSFFSHASDSTPGTVT